MKKDYKLWLKVPFQIGKLLSFSILLFRQKKKNRIGSENVARNKAFILVNLMHNHRMSIIGNPLLQLHVLKRLSKYYA